MSESLNPPSRRLKRGCSRLRELDREHETRPDDGVPLGPAELRRFVALCRSMKSDDDLDRVLEACRPEKRATLYAQVRPYLTFVPLRELS